MPKHPFGCLGLWWTWPPKILSTFWVSHSERFFLSMQNSIFAIIRNHFWRSLTTVWSFWRSSKRLKSIEIRRTRVPSDLAGQAVKPVYPIGAFSRWYNLGQLGALCLNSPLGAMHDLLSSTAWCGPGCPYLTFTHESVRQAWHYGRQAWHYDLLLGFVVAIVVVLSSKWAMPQLEFRWAKPQRKKSRFGNRR